MVGHSFGGKVATLYTLQHPEKVQKLILYSVTIPFGKSANKYFGLKRFIAGSIVLYASVIIRAFKNQGISFRDYKQLSGIHKAVHSKHEFDNKLINIKQPVLLIAGRFDFISSLNYQKAFAKQFPNATLAIFNQSTHQAHKEEKEKFIQALNKFIG